jgi:hypothetical protein
MSISTVVTAALPIPVAAFQLIPTYHFQTKLLSVYTSLFCFLTLAFIFYSRHALARWMFVGYFADTEGYYAIVTSSPSVALPEFGSVTEQREIEEEEAAKEMRNRRRKARRRIITATLVGLAPLFLIIASVVCIFLYHNLLYDSVWDFLASHRGAVSPSFDEVLAGADQSEVSGQSSLLLSYLAIFVSAEAAFVLMAMKEYLQDYLGLSDGVLIEGQPPLATVAASAPVEIPQSRSDAEEPRDGPTEPSEGSDRGGVAPEGERPVSWWRRLFGA